MCTVASHDKSLRNVGAVGKAFYKVGGEAIDQVTT